MSDYDQDEMIAMIGDCESRESKLTDWEVGFIASLSENIEIGRKLTELQVEKLSNIWERVT